MLDTLHADTVALIARSQDVAIMLPHGIAWPLGCMTLLGAYMMASEIVELGRAVIRVIKRHV